jgi:RNase adaptor protein for sRNA GlmZ degradation
MTKAEIFLIVGVPGSGKSWIAEQLEDRLNYVRHDDSKDQWDYIGALRDAAYSSRVPVIAEAPFSVKSIMEPLNNFGIKVTPFYITESKQTLSERYWNREQRVIPKMHLTRAATYAKRAEESGAIRGTSSEILEAIRGLQV